MVNLTSTIDLLSKIDVPSLPAWERHSWYSVHTPLLAHWNMIKLSMLFFPLRSLSSSFSAECMKMGCHMFHRLMPPDEDEIYSPRRVKFRSVWFSGILLSKCFHISFSSRFSADTLLRRMSEGPNLKLMTFLSFWFTTKFRKHASTKISNNCGNIHYQFYPLFSDFSSPASEFPTHKILHWLGKNFSGINQETFTSLLAQLQLLGCEQ